MTHEEKLNWMAIWCAQHNCQLQLEGECGFGRECVGILNHGNYPDYNPDVVTFIPENAYHKHDCVAVLGRGEPAEDQLFAWLQWFDANGFTVEHSVNADGMHPLQVMLGQHNKVCMVKKQEAQ